MQNDKEDFLAVILREKKILDHLQALRPKLREGGQKLQVFTFTIPSPPP